MYKYMLFDLSVAYRNNGTLEENFAGPLLDLSSSSFPFFIAANYYKLFKSPCALGE